MSVKANWFAELSKSADTTDPFACHVEQLGLEVDLRDPEALQRTFHELNEREAALYEQGITCGIRDRKDTSCSACPVARTDVLDRLTPLCDVGKDMERVTTTLAAHAIEPKRPDSGLTSG